VRNEARLTETVKGVGTIMGREPKKNRSWENGKKGEEKDVGGKLGGATTHIDMWETFTCPKGFKRRRVRLGGGLVMEGGGLLLR